MQFDIASQIFDRVNRVLNKTTEGYRDKLDEMLHVLEFSYGALKASDPDLTKEDYDTLYAEIKKQYPNINNLETAIERVGDRQNNKYPNAFVEDAAFGTYILGINYDALQGKLVKILKNIPHAKVFTSVDENGKTVTNIGHIPGSKIQALRSPLSSKILDAIKITPAGQPRMGLLRGLSKLYKSHIFEVKYTFTRDGFDINAFNKILGKMTVLVTLQTKERNAAFANQVEAVLNRELKTLVQDAGFLGQIINAPGSRSIKQDAIQSIVATLRGEKLKPEVHKPIVKKKTIVVKTKIPVTNHAVKLKIKDPSSGKFASTSSLLTLLNFHLHDVVAANMGDGNERRILNYRTGRLATSTRVERVSVARDGMVTAFYNYMKYPYATFSDGGKQQYPKSRDPKILISKSIRQIAAKMMIQRMRAVVV